MKLPKKKRLRTIYFFNRGRDLTVQAVAELAPGCFCLLAFPPIRKRNLKIKNIGQVQLSLPLPDKAARKISLSLPLSLSLSSFSLSEKRKRKFSLDFLGAKCYFYFIFYFSVVHSSLSTKANKQSFANGQLWPLFHKCHSHHSSACFQILGPTKSPLKSFFSK